MNLLGLSISTMVIQESKQKSAKMEVMEQEGSGGEAIT